MADRLNITSPVGRIVAGSLYRPNDKNFDGQPLVYKTGADAGKPRVQFFFAIAIPKKPGENHWANTEWGSQIWVAGHKAFPQAAQRPDFSWKIDDGDSQIPNKRNKKPCEQEGYPGHWIIKLSNGFAPTIYQQQGSQWVQITEPEFVKPGYFIQVAFSVDGNGQQGNPGVYLNPGMVCFRGYGPEINFGPNVEEAGFGAAPLPAGASLVPLAAASMPAAPGSPGASSYVPQPPAPPAAQTAPPVPVYPNPGFVQVPPNPSSASSVGSQSTPAGLTPPPPPATNVFPSNTRRMTAAAGAVSYEAYVAAGWNDAQLIANGLMTV